MKTFIALLLISQSVIAADIYDPQSGKYLGQLGGSQYSTESTNNPYGRYGSVNSPDSINNPNGIYGSQYSTKSPNNPYATQAPIIIENGLHNNE